MKLVTRQSKANTAAQRWKQQFNWSNDVWVFGIEKKSIYNKLAALGDNPSPDDVDFVIGNNAWTKSMCHGGHYAEDIIQFEDNEYDEAISIMLCKECLQKAMELFDK